MKLGGYILIIIVSSLSIITASTLWHITGGMANADNAITVPKGEAVLTHARLIELPDEGTADYLCDLNAIECPRTKESSASVNTPKNAEIAPRIVNLGITATVSPSEKVGYTRSAITAIIERKALEYGVDPNLMLDIAFCESSFFPNARSKISSATGLYQFLRATWQEGCRRKGWDCTLDDRLNPELNAEMAAYFISIGQVSRWNESKACWK